MINRRDAITGSILGAAGAAMTASGAQAAGAPQMPDNAEPMLQHGQVFTPIAESNPLQAKIIVFNTVSPSIPASIHYYRDVIGMTLADEGVLGADVSGAPGIGKAGRRYATLTMPNTGAAMIRVFEAPPGAKANRPRPNSGPNDPGLLIMEGGTSDPAESYHRLKAAGVPTITPPRYYFFRNSSWNRDIDVMSYTAFGPGGEQMFITANVRNDAPDWPYKDQLHSGFSNTAIVSLDQRPVEAFYDKALGLKRTSQMDSYSKNSNLMIGAPADFYYLWGNIGSGVSIEVWEVKAKTGMMYPTSLDRTGLAMVTMRVNDLAKCRAMCQAAGIRMMGQGALPLPGKPHQDGFVIRGAVGELVEVVQA
jgi:catechol 2,3-dioxygenase-like lactoylglutathione lyase family enzyme